MVLPGVKPPPLEEDMDILGYHIDEAQPSDDIRVPLMELESIAIDFHLGGKLAAE